MTTKNMPETENSVINLKEELENLLIACRKNLRRVDEEMISKAFYLVTNTYKDKLRRSGDPYYTHPLAVAKIVVNELPLDDISVVSALLHDIFNYSDEYSYKDIKSEFGSAVAQIVDNVAKIKHIESQNIEQLENYRKLLLSLFTDVRIILIKLADRLHNMRTLEFLPADKQKKVANETLSIYAPFAHRFGLGSFKWELEDLAFKYLNNKAYNDIRSALRLNRKQRMNYIERFSDPIKEAISKDKSVGSIPYEITGRAKHLYSIYNKLKLRVDKIENMYDLYAVRIILDTEYTNTCFLVYGLITRIYKPVPGTFKDYISNPKKNGYRSLHTAVVGPGGKHVEVQIRTREMHEISEKGVAAHFDYKRGTLPAQSIMDKKNIEDWMSLVREIFEHAGDSTPEQLLESVRYNLLLDEIYVFTPASEFRILPKDSTPLDFAYSIHTELGHTCIGAKVNGKVVPFNYKLRSGDQIEILNSKKQKPTAEWLDFVVTHRAKHAIHRFLNGESRVFQMKGKQTFEDILKKMNLKFRKRDYDKMLNFLRFNDIDEFFYAVGAELFDLAALHEYLKELTSGRKNQKDTSLNGINKNQKNAVVYNSGKAILDEGRVDIKYAPCCTPLPGDEIYGIINERSEMWVHRRKCPQVEAFLSTNQPFVFELDWSMLSKKNFTAKIKIEGEESPGLLNDINNLIASLKNTFIRGIHFDSSGNLLRGFLTLEVKDLKHLNRLFDLLKGINGIKKVERYLEM